MRFVDQYQGKNDQLLLVKSKSSISQTFISNKGNLAGIRLYMSNPNLGGKNLYLLTITKNDQIVRQETFSESNVGWEMTFRYDFVPIVSSPRDKFKLSISGENSGNELNPKDLGIAYSNKDLYPNGSAFLENTILSGDIVFETYYSTNIQVAVNNIMKNTINRFNNDRTFCLFYILILIAILLASIASIRLELGRKN